MNSLQPSATITSAIHMESDNMQVRNLGIEYLKTSLKYLPLVLAAVIGYCLSYKQSQSGIS